MTDTTPLKPRKKPRQQRSRVTVDAIVDATARVLVEDGFDKASTNRIAKVAGVSVGSLYQYFPNKEALVMAVVDRHTDQMISVLEQSAVELLHAPIPVAVRSYVRTMLAAHRVDPELHRVIVQQVLHLGMAHVDGVQRRARAVVRLWLESHRHEILPTDLDAAAFVLVTSVESVTHGAVLYGLEQFEDEAMEDELVALVCRYLLGATDPEPGAPRTQGAAVR